MPPPPPLTTTTTTTTKCIVNIKHGAKSSPFLSVGAWTVVQCLWWVGGIVRPESMVQE